MNQNLKTTWQAQENIPYTNIKKSPELHLQIDTHSELFNTIPINNQSISLNELVLNSDCSTFNSFNESHRELKESSMITEGKVKYVSNYQMEQGDFFSLNKPKETEYLKNACYEFDDAFIEMSSFELDPQNCPINEKKEIINHPSILDSELSDYVQNLSFEHIGSLDNSEMEEELICKCDDPECLWNNLKRNRNGTKVNKNIKFNQQGQPQEEIQRSGKMNQELDNSYEKLRSKKVRIKNNYQIHSEQNVKTNFFLESSEDKQNFSRSLEANRQISFLHSFSEIEEQEELENLLLEMENKNQLDRKLQISSGTNNKVKN